MIHPSGELLAAKKGLLDLEPLVGPEKHGAETGDWVCILGSGLLSSVTSFHRGPQFLHSGMKGLAEIITKIPDILVQHDSK